LKKNERKGQRPCWRRRLAWAGGLLLTKTEQLFGGKMKIVIQRIAPLVIALAVYGCGDKEDSARRTEEAQKAIQQGAQRERQMYEGMQKGAENLEKQETKK
jgi:hypothetical protein